MEDQLYASFSVNVITYPFASVLIYFQSATLHWRHNGRDGVLNHQPHLNHWFRHRSKKTPKLLVTDHCAGNLPVTGEFPAQMASNAENVSIWWRLHDMPNLVRQSGGNRDVLQQKLNAINMESVPVLSWNMKSIAYNCIQCIFICATQFSPLIGGK